MITIERSQRIFQLASQLNTAAAALLATTQLRTVCAWCVPSPEADSDGPVSHGICSACAEQFEKGGAR